MKRRLIALTLCLTSLPFVLGGCATLVGSDGSAFIYAYPQPFYYVPAPSSFYFHFDSYGHGHCH